MRGGRLGVRIESRHREELLRVSPYVPSRWAENGTVVRVNVRLQLRDESLIGVDREEVTK